MRKNYLSMLITVLMLAGIPGMAQSAIVTETFIGTAVNGPLTGDIGTGSFTYDDDLLVKGDELIGPTDGLTVTFSFDGQAFDQTNDEGFDEYPELEFSFSIPIALDYLLVDGENGVNFNNPIIAGLGMLELFPSFGGYDFETELSASYVPIPAAIWLFGSGIAGLVGLRIRKRYKT